MIARHETKDKPSAKRSDPIETSAILETGLVMSTRSVLPVLCLALNSKSRVRVRVPDEHVDVFVQFVRSHNTR